jgi:hypothetical protein
VADPTAPEHREPPADLSNVDWSQAVVCYTRCWSCQFDYHQKPPKAHTWMDKEDAEHAGHPWPLPPEVAAAKPCACPCAKPKDAAR